MVVPAEFNKIQTSVGRQGLILTSYVIPAEIFFNMDRLSGQLIICGHFPKKRIERIQQADRK